MSAAPDAPQPPFSIAASPAAAGVPRLRNIGERVVISSLTKRYRDVVALDDVSLDIAPGELVCILGPSGSGKTTTLMIVAGFSEGAYQGEVLVGGRRIDNLPPNRRGIGVVFQHLELFPHMNVEDNVAFPLRMRGESARSVTQRTQAALELVRLSAFGKRLPAQLSGGQRQRVALARAVVYAPPVLLLDEPFGALDKSLREDMQAELRSLNKQLGITVIHVTHDQVEAMAISDRIVVMNKGRVEQIGAPHDIYFAPASRFVGGFVGESVFLEGRLEGVGADGRCDFRTREGLRIHCHARQALQPGQEASVMVRPEHIQVLDGGQTADNRFDAEVVDTTFTGDRLHYSVVTASGGKLRLSVQSSPAAESILSPGARLAIGWSAQHALLLT
jgi:ABC-type Fe3+/spermidine/putrescine transport system ATPase subunit